MVFLTSSRLRSPKWILLLVIFFGSVHLLITHSKDLHHLRESWRGYPWRFENTSGSEDSQSQLLDADPVNVDSDSLELGLRRELCQGSNLSNNIYRCLGLEPTKLPKLPLPSDRFTTNNNNNNNKPWPPSNGFMSSLQRLSYTPLPKSCIDSHFAEGAPCSAFSSSFSNSENSQNLNSRHLNTRNLNGEGGNGGNGGNEANEGNSNGVNGVASRDDQGQGQEDGSTTPNLNSNSQASGAAPTSLRARGGRGLDVVWIWANGSDPLFQDAMYEAGLGQKTVNPKIRSAKTKLYRDHDELRHSIRSVLQHFTGHTTKLHVVTPDLGDSTGRRYGVLPQWLNFRDIFPGSDSTNSDGSSNPSNEDSSASNGSNGPNAAGRHDSSKSSNIPTPWRDGAVELNIMHHSQVFENLPNSTFNSFSIESQLSGLTTTSDPYVYMNDDFFFAKDLTTSDFYSSPYGIVLKLDPNLPVPGEERPTDSAAGEWGPLKYTNWLLSQRFGSRTRPYMVHVAKTISPMILREIQATWPSEFSDTSSHRFRGQRDVYTTFLHSHFLVERWRELLLWSWIVGRVGNDDDSWTEEQSVVAWEELGGNVITIEGDDRIGGIGGGRTEYRYSEQEAYVYMRFTLEKERIRDHLANAGEPSPTATEYVFSNLDGYPYSLLVGARDWPRIAGGRDDPEADFKSHRWSHCKLDHDRCFPKGKKASEMFEHIAFNQSTHCGDCIITALVQKSGRLGLSAFLPPKHRIKYHSTKGRLVQDVDPLSNPTLPLTKTPQEASFALKDVLAPWGTVSVRDWILRAMERYRFVIAHTPADFAMLKGPRTAERWFRKMDADDDLALITINDDVTIREQETDRLFRAFLSRRWGFPSAWEA